MSILYKSARIGKNGVPFVMYKLRTLKEGTDKTSSFAQQDQYTTFGRLLRATKIDELPQLWNLLKGDIALVGPRPEEERAINIIPKETRDILLSVKPGMTSLASIHFFNEEAILKDSQDAHKDYWERIKPTKILLDVFYIEHRSVLLKLFILWETFKKIIKSLV